MQFDPALFPAFESPYCKLETPGLALSQLALHLQLVLTSGNSLHNERHKGHYFFRNESVPLPRPATFLAWRQICRVGNPDHSMFILPFLPSLRADDEVGDAIQTKGAKVPSLSRKAGIHLRDGEKRIIWGSVYLADSQSIRKDGSCLVAEIDRSNLTEAQILPQQYIWKDSQSVSIRHRMEFLASYGFPASNDMFAGTHVPKIHRLLFQFFTQKSAEVWSEAYALTESLIEADPAQRQADYLQFLEEAVESRRSGNNDDSENTENEGRLGKSSQKVRRFGSLDDISF